MARKRREWSRAFTPRGAKTVNLNISGVPPTLRQKFQAKCRRVGKSQRNLILGWVKNWVEGRRPDEDKPEMSSLPTIDTTTAPSMQPPPEPTALHLP